MLSLFFTYLATKSFIAILPATAAFMLFKDENRKYMGYDYNLYMLWKFDFEK